MLKRAVPVLGLGVLLGFAGPFASNPPLSLSVRLAFWVGMVVVGYGAALVAGKLIPAGSIARPGPRLIAVAIASALPLTFVAAWIVPLLRPGHAYQPLQLPALFATVAAVQLAIVFILLRSPGNVPAVPTGEPNKPDGPATIPRTLLSRLPSRLGTEIVALEAEDHYLRVHTMLGSDLVLMRLSDAIAAIGPDLGLQVHRSWWVARDAIREVVRTDQRSQLRLMNGLTVPVGRTYTAAVRGAVDLL
ncbi:LytTR family DNA-binding domain-containing protein [Sphingomonas lutea]